VTASIKDLNASGIWRFRSDDESPQLQLAVDASLVADVRLQRFQDLLCLQAVWVDRIPILDLGSNTPVHCDASHLDIRHTAPKRRLVAVRVRKVEVSADVVVSQVKLTIEPVVFRSVFHTSQILSLEFRQLEVTASGGISGWVRNPNIAFAASRKARHSNATIANLLDIRLDIADILAQVELEGQRMANLQ
jgi:hypothetical protein